jgi:hypothetical protein
MNDEWILTDPRPGTTDTVDIGASALYLAQRPGRKNHLVEHGEMGWADVTLCGKDATPLQLTPVKDAQAVTCRTCQRVYQTNYGPPHA